LQQHRYALPEPYLAWERQYLADHPDLQRVMDVMVGTTAGQLEDPTQDILHNRVCAALAYRMATDMDLPGNDRRLITAGDLLHNISKEDRAQVLTDAHLMQEASGMVARLRGAGRLGGSPGFWTDPGLFARSAVGDSLSLVHHITGAVAAGNILESVKGYPRQDILRVQETIVTHSTGYWYFRDSVDEAAGVADAWRSVFPEPEGTLPAIVHDADLISQFDTASVVPEGSKWRALAAKRWGARGAAEEAHVIYFVLQRLLAEARTPQGGALAAQEWSRVRPELVRLMGLPGGSDPLRLLGVPKPFR
jgi:hypothetical protein